MRPGCRFVPLESGEAVLFLLYSLFFFFFFYFLVLRLRSKFNRTLCEFRFDSAGLRTHSSLGRDRLEKQDACHGRICFSNHRGSAPSSRSASSLDTLL